MKQLARDYMHPLGLVGEADWELVRPAHEDTCVAEPDRQVSFPQMGPKPPSPAAPESVGSHYPVGPTVRLGLLDSPSPFSLLSRNRELMT